MAMFNLFLPLISGKLTIVGTSNDLGLTLDKILFWNNNNNKLGVVLNTYYHSTQNYKTRRLGGRGQPSYKVISKQI